MNGEEQTKESTPITNTSDLGTIGIGNKEKPKLDAKPCLVKMITVKPTNTKKGGKVEIVEFHVKHPAKEDLIRITSASIMRQRKDKKEIVSTGTFLDLDEDGNLQKGSPLADILVKYGAKTIPEMQGKTVETEIGSDNYLCIKAY